MRRVFCLAVMLFAVAPAAHAQDVDSLLDALTEQSSQTVSATFKSSRIVNGHSIEQMAAGTLDVRIHHRFGALNSGAGEFWGLDVSTVFLGLEYGVTDGLMVGIGRSSYEKTYSAFAKLRLLRQSTGEAAMPVAVSVLGGVDAYTMDWPHIGRPERFSDRVATVLQLLVARKISERLSLQITPTIVHRTYVPVSPANNMLVAVGIGGRFKLSNRTSLNAEYHPIIVAHDPDNPARTSTLSVGCDIETGGHVFQVMLTNALPMFERGFIGETSTTWGAGGVHLGFNISRVFSL